jgi:hypothetical protein
MKIDQYIIESQLDAQRLDFEKELSILSGELI